ncbi:MAG: YbaK/EbsC family protein [Bacillus sp. (in: firmicutes)]
MSLASVTEHFKQFNMENKIMEFDQSSATVEQAANAIGVQPARIAKTLSFRNDDSALLVVTAGDTKIDNKKFRDTFGMKARMLSPDEVLSFTGHAIGGVCPFGLEQNLNIYLDESLQRFETVFPACGSKNSAIELTCQQLFTYSNAIKWVDVCKPNQ